MIIIEPTEKGIYSCPFDLAAELTDILWGDGVFMTRTVSSISEVLEADIRKHRRLNSLELAGYIRLKEAS